MSGTSVIVHPPLPTGGREVTIGTTFLGVAYGTTDVTEFLRRAGMDDVDELVVETTALIEWRGGGPEDWPSPAA